MKAETKKTNNGKWMVVINSFGVSKCYSVHENKEDADRFVAAYNKTFGG